MSRRNRRAHLNDYELSDDGGYEYRGTLWRWKRPEQRESFLRAAWALLGGAAACLVAAGFVPAVGVGTTFIVLVPYITSFVAAALSAGALWKLTHEGDKVRDHVYHSAVEGLTPRLFVGLVAAIACAVGQAICVVVRVGEVTSAPLAAVYLLCMLGCALCLGLLLKRLGAQVFVQAS